MQVVADPASIELPPLPLSTVSHTLLCSLHFRFFFKFQQSGACCEIKENYPGPRQRFSVYKEGKELRRKQGQVENLCSVRRLMFAMPRC